jgi:hypothetical protein
MLINPYSPESTFKNFPKLDDSLNSYYDRIFHTVIDFPLTPRYIFETGLKISFRDTFYYIDRLYDNNPNTVIDVGCGECVWKNWFPNIIGFDPNTNEFSSQDFVDFFDKDFSIGHTKNYDCGLALNSLHFISWNDIANQIDLAMNIVKDKFLFTFNFNILSDKPQTTVFEQIKEFRKIIDSLEYDVILFDVPILRGVDMNIMLRHLHINGTVRFILKHQN